MAEKTRQEQLAASGYRLPSEWFAGEAEERKQTRRVAKPDAEPVRYASEAAAAAAKEAGLTAADFAGQKGSGADGGFTAGDVRKLAESKTAE